jgi:Tfp pilus assembly pilus retraction ATPase PilT
VETAEEALRASLMGAVIFATIHGSDAGEAVRSFLQELPAGRQEWGQKALAAALRIVVACRLVRDDARNQIWPIHEVLFNMKRDTGVAAHIRSGEFNKLAQDIEGARGTKQPYYMQSFRDSLLMRIAERRLPRSLLADAAA